MKIKPIIAILSTLGLVAATPAYAMLTVSGSGTAGTSYTFGPASDSSYISGSDNRSDGVGSSAYSSAWGNSYGTYRASASGGGTFDSQGKFNRALTVENTSAFATQYSLNVFIYYGGLGISNYAGVSGSGWTSYDLDITKGSTNLFDSYAKLDSTGVLTQTGTVLNGAYVSMGSSYSQYYWNGTNLTLDLGSLGAGQSMTINFDLVTTAHGDFGVNSYSCGGYGDYGGDMPATLSVAGDGDGYGGYGGTCYDTASVYGSLGDPSDPYNFPDKVGFMNITGQQVSQVPLPGTLSLIGLGLLGLGSLRRKAIRI